MRNIVLSGLLLITFSVCGFADVLAVWNFNDADLFSTNRGSGSMTSDFAPANISSYSGSALNADGGDPAGQALRLSGNANNGKNLTWMVSTAGYEAIDVSLAAMRTGTGFSDNRFLYSFDSGSTWNDFLHFSPGTTFGIHNFDFSGIANLNDNPDALFRIVFGGATSSSGNARIDNIVVSGLPISTTPVPEPSTIMLVAGGTVGLLLVGRRKILKPQDSR